MRFLIGQLRVAEQGPGAEAAGDSLAPQEEEDSNLAWEQTARMHSGVLLFLALLQTLLQENLQAAWLLASPGLPLASSLRALLAPLVLAAPPQEQQVALRVSKLRVERRQVLQVPVPEAPQAAPLVELEQQAWLRRELEQRQLAAEGLQEQEEPQPPEGVAEAPLRPASCELL
jgi:hypothetical protein